jgi:hypothetical protein
VCLGVLVGAQTARRSAAVTVASAPDDLVDQAAQAGLLYGPREGACYYVLSQSDTLGSSNASALLGEEVGTSAWRKDLPRMVLLDRLRLLPGTFFYATYVPRSLLDPARLEILGDARVSELRATTRRCRRA